MHFMKRQRKFIIPVLGVFRSRKGTEDEVEVRVLWDHNTENYKTPKAQMKQISQFIKFARL